MESCCSSLQPNVRRTMMKMAPASTITLFLLCCSVISSTGSPCERNAVTGGSFDVPLNLTLGEISTLKWRKDTTVIFWKRQTVLTGKPDDISPTGSLRLRNLTKSNTGLYIPEAFKSEGRAVLGLNSTYLCVLDPVQKPKVTQKCLESKVRFDCIPNQNDGNVKVEWLKNNIAWKQQKTQTVIKEAKDVDKVTFACNVSNSVSSVTSEPVTQTCYKSVFPDELFGISIWVFVGGGGGIVLVLILVVIICCVRTKQRQQLQIKDEEELRLGWTNPEQQQQPHHHHHHHHHQHQHQHHPDHQHPPNHHHQQRPAGHTGPRQSRSKQHRDQQRPRAPEPPKGHPQANARRPPQPRPADTTEDEQPPPLPQPRKKGPRTQRV